MVASAQDAPPNRVRDRYNRVAKGANVSEWARRLSDPDPAVRLDAVDSLGKDGSKDAVKPLLEATADADQRIRLKAIDYLGAIGDETATPQLVQFLYLADTDAMTKQHVVGALGRIGDKSATPALLNCAKNPEDQSMLTTALYALGEIADPAAKPDLEAIRDTSKDPLVKRLAGDAVVKIDKTVVAAPNTQPTLIELEKRLRPPAEK